MNVELITGIIAGLFVILGPIITLIITRYFERKHEQELAHRDKKISLYSDILKFMFSFFSIGVDGHINTNKLNPDQQVIKFRDIQRDLILWAGPKTIISYYDFHKAITTPPARAEQVIKLLDFYLSVREDLGLSNKRIDETQLARFMFKNPELLVNQYRINPNVTLSELVELEKSQIQPKK